MTPGDRSGYRRDIDGLRAIAVLAVLVHHLQVSWLPGGYTGVDIFFVISGFLITTLVHGELIAGRFSVRRFYQRRINRLLPALLLVISSAAVVGWIVLSPHDLVMFAQSAFTSLIGVSNIFFWQQYGNYFAVNADEAVLLHTWTLGVEEQFYLFWPLLMVVATRLFSRRLVPFGLVLAFVALIVSEYGARNYASASYYLLPTRFFELAIGGVLGLWLRGRTEPGAAEAATAGVTGFVLLIAGLVLLEPSSQFPGVSALLPCMGTAFLIYAGSRSSALSARLLSWQPLVIIGLLSYSAYLWHWPVLAYVRYLDVPISLPLAAAIVGIVLFLSWLTWKYVEVPFRRDGAKLPFDRVLVRRFAIPALTFGLIAVVATNTGGFPGRFDSTVAAYETMVATHPDLLRDGCHVPTALFQTPPTADCRLGSATAPVDGILLGDSYANHYTGMVDEMAKSEGVALMDYTMDACPPIPGYRPPGLESYSQRCVARNEYAFDYVDRMRFRHVVLAANWPEEASVAGLIAPALDRLIKSGATVTVILTNPYIDDGSSCPIRRLMYHDGRDCVGADTPQAAYWMDLEKRFEEVTFLRPSDVICRDGVCDPVLDGVLLYRDDGHLDDIGSRLLGQKLVERGVRLVPSKAEP